MSDIAPTLAQPDDALTVPPLPVLISGMWRNAPHMGDYRSEWLQEMLVERVTWGAEAPTVHLQGTAVAAPGHIWFRFWLPEQDQVVEKYFDANRRPVGLYIPVCAPLQRQGESYATKSLLLALWLDLPGRVTIMHEKEFESGVARGRMTLGEFEIAETNIRRLTGGVAAGTFPPAMVRNFALA